MESLNFFFIQFALAYTFISILRAQNSRLACVCVGVHEYKWKAPWGGHCVEGADHGGGRIMFRLG